MKEGDQAQAMIVGRTIVVAIGMSMIFGGTFAWSGFPLACALTGVALFLWGLVP